MIRLFFLPMDQLANDVARKAFEKTINTMEDQATRASLHGSVNVQTCPEGLVAAVSVHKLQTLHPHLPPQLVPVNEADWNRAVAQIDAAQPGIL